MKNQVEMQHLRLVQCWRMKTRPLMQQQQIVCRLLLFQCDLVLAIVSSSSVSVTVTMSVSPPQVLLRVVRPVRLLSAVPQLPSFPAPLLERQQRWEGTQMPYCSMNQGG